MTHKMTMLLAGVGLLAAREVRADDPDQAMPPPPPTVPVVSDPATQPEPTYPQPEVYEAVPAPYSYAWMEPTLRSGIGIGFTVGGGVTGFTDKALRDTVSSDVGGLWDFRASIGTHIPLGIDVTYLGTAQNVNTLQTGQANGTLIGTTVEGALRFNMLPHNDLNPYVFGGVGWQRYDVHNMVFAHADTGLAQNDNLVEFPMGAGLSYRDPSGFTVDARGTFRAATASTLVIDPRTGNYADLHSWEASAALGYEF